MTFLEFFQARMAVVTPDGDSRRLDARHKNWVRSDLITLQTYARPFQSGNLSTYLTWTDECGASYVVSPYGSLTDARIRSSEADCDFIQCTPVTEITMKRYQKRYQMCSCSATAGTGESTGGSGGSSSTSLFGILGVTALRQIVPEDYKTYPLLYLNTEGDGLGGWFVYQPADTHADDGVDYLIPSSITRPTAGSFVRSSSL